LKSFLQKLCAYSQLGSALGLSVSFHVAQAQRDRVMGSAGEGSQHRIMYLGEMEKKAAEREHCRVLAGKLIFPELSKYSDLGLGRGDGPSRALLDEANLKRAVEKAHSYRAELLRIALTLSSVNSSRDKPTRAHLQRKVDSLIREYRIHSQASQSFAKESLRKRELAALNFRAFAQAVLVVSRSHECQSLWNALKPHIPMRLGQKLSREKLKASALVASLEKHSVHFSRILAHIRMPKGGQNAVADTSAVDIEPSN
jgi:hypothetical protein